LERVNAEPVETLPLVTLRPRTPIYARVNARARARLPSARA